MIGVMFLIAVVSIVEGMGRYMEDDFAGRLLGANTFTLRRYPWFGNNVDARASGSSGSGARASTRPTSAFIRSRACRRHALGRREPGQRRWRRRRTRGRGSVEAHAVDGDYFTIKKYDLTVRPHDRAAGVRARHAGRRHRRRSREVLLPEPESGRARAAHRRHSVPGHRRHRAPGHAVRPVARQARDRAVQLAAAPADQSARRHRRPARAVVERR